MTRTTYFRNYRKTPQWRRYNRAYQYQYKQDRKALELAVRAAGATGFERNGAGGV